MNLYPDAFSFQLKRMISADDAHQMALRHDLDDARAFKCSPSCDVPLICINFKKKRSECKMRPHFRKQRMTQVHHPQCERFRRHSDPKPLQTYPRALIHFDEHEGFKKVTRSLPRRNTTHYPSFGQSGNTPSTQVQPIQSIHDFVNAVIRFAVGELADDFIDPPFHDWIHDLTHEPLLRLNHLGLYFGVASATLFHYDGYKSGFKIRISSAHTVDSLKHVKHPIFLLNTFYLKKNNPKMHQFLMRANTTKDAFLIVYCGSFKLVKGRYINPTHKPQFLNQNLALYPLNCKRSQLLLQIFKTKTQT